MPSAKDVRETIEKALKQRNKPLGPIEVITAMKVAGFRTYDRTYLRDFLIERKASLHQDFREDFAEFLGIDPGLLRISKPREIDQIRKGAKVHYYITEHMKARGWNDNDLAQRMDGINADIVRQWRASKTLQEWQAAGFAAAFGFDNPNSLAQPPAVSAKPARLPKRKRA